VRGECGTNILEQIHNPFLSVKTIALSMPATRDEKEEKRGNRQKGKRSEEKEAIRTPDLSRLWTLFTLLPPPVFGLACQQRGGASRGRGR
jgi:hypothetical protein